MEINAKTKVCGLIGWPVEHSVSPIIHNGLAEIYNRNLVYVPLPVKPGRLQAAVAGAEAFGFAGMNVTVPYKSEVIPYLKEIDPLAKQIGAVNTLVPMDGGYKGYNTDMPGLYRAMCADGVQITGEEVILLGAGGVARAIAFLLLDKGAKQLYILNRSRERAKKLAAEVNQAARRRKESGVSEGRGGNLFEENADWERDFAVSYTLDEYNKLDQSRRYLAIQATNVGMFPNTGHAVIEDEDFYRLVKIGYDVIFNPTTTRFMELVRASGGQAFHGLKMLLYQGLIAWELWNDTAVSEETAETIYQRMEKALGV